MRSTGVYDIPGVTVLEGRWQEWLPDKMDEVIGSTREGMGFDVVFVDTFAEGYEGESVGLGVGLGLGRDVCDGSRG